MKQSDDENAMLDEALQVVTALWRGERISHAGEHYRVDGAIQTPTPLQQPRIPIWCAAVWPNRAPLRRAARWDGVVPVGSLSPAAAGELLAEVKRHRRAATPFDLVLPSSAGTGGSIAEYADAGVTWWLHSIVPTDDLATTRTVVDSGPPIE